MPIACLPLNLSSDQSMSKFPDEWQGRNSRATRSKKKKKTEVKESSKLSPSRMAEPNENGPKTRMLLDDRRNNFVHNAI